MKNTLYTYNKLDNNYYYLPTPNMCMAVNSYFLQMRNTQITRLKHQRLVCEIHITKSAYKSGLLWYVHYVQNYICEEEDILHIT